MRAFRHRGWRWIAHQELVAEHADQPERTEDAEAEPGEAGPVALIQEGMVRGLRPWPTGSALGLEALATDPSEWPRVDIVLSHAGVVGVVVDALVAAGSRGLVVEGTGNGTVHEALLGALERARALGLPVWRSTRCAGAAVVGAPDGALHSAGDLSPAKARIELMLRLLTSAA